MGRDFNVTSFPVKKGGTQVLFSALTATVTAANSPSINMTSYTGGSLQSIVSGNGGAVSFQVLTSEDGITFVPAYTYAATPVVFPPVVTTTGVSAAFQVSGIYAKYVKFVPTVSGLAATPTFSALVSFTPSDS